MGEGVIKSANLINRTDGSIHRWVGVVRQEACAMREGSVWPRPSKVISWLSRRMTDDGMGRILKVSRVTIRPVASNCIFTLPDRLPVGSIAI